MTVFRDWPSATLTLVFACGGESDFLILCFPINYRIALSARWRFMTGIAPVDILIIGAGPAGLAAGLACRDAGLGVAVAETSKVASTEAAKGRSAALFNKTAGFLRKLGVWEACADAAEPLRALQFIDCTGRRLRAPDCAFRAEEIGEQAFGYNIANADLARILAVAAERSGLKLLSMGRLFGLGTSGPEACATFEDGTELRAPLVIAADGRMSATRQAAGIRSLTWPYDQIAIAASFSHERKHHGVCIEFHRSGGPLTLIPLPGDRSSLVWTERTPEARRILALDGPSFCRELERNSRFVLGRVFDPSERAGFPSSSVLVREYGRSRVALIGEAAHGAPPIGAQGLNLGFRDVETLAALVAGAASRGEDIGGDNSLRAYSAARRGDIVSRTFGLDLLNRSLLSGSLPLQAARGLGLYALGTIGPLRRAFMRRGIAPAGSFKSGN
jgi:2-octaprenyl-6-methoxyphenol hydroxylase